MGSTRLGRLFRLVYFFENPFEVDSVEQPVVVDRVTVLFDFPGLASIAKRVFANAKVLSGFRDLHVVIELGHG